MWELPFTCVNYEAKTNIPPPPLLQRDSVFHEIVINCIVIIIIIIKIHALSYTANDNTLFLLEKLEEFLAEELYTSMYVDVRVICRIPNFYFGRSIAWDVGKIEDSW